MATCAQDVAAGKATEHLFQWRRIHICASRAISKVVKAKGKRARRLRQTAAKAFNRVDDFKELLDIPKWHQARCKALTNEAAELMGDGLKVRRHTHAGTHTHKHSTLLVRLGG